MPSKTTNPHAPKKRGRPPGKATKPYVVTPGKDDTRFKAKSTKTRALGSIRVPEAIAIALEAEGRTLTWSERIEKAMKRLIAPENAGSNTINDDDFAF